MKLLHITTLALCLNMSVTHTDPVCHTPETNFALCAVSCAVGVGFVMSGTRHIWTTLTNETTDEYASINTQTHNDRKKFAKLGFYPIAMGLTAIIVSNFAFAAAASNCNNPSDGSGV